MRRILAATATAIALLFGFAAPAHAAQQFHTCTTFGENGKACLYAYVTFDNDGTGMVVNDVTIQIFGGFYETKALDCDNLRLWNDGQVVKWAKYGADCDVYKSPGYRTYHPDAVLNQSQNAFFGWTFYPKMDQEVDPGRVHISMTIYS